MQQQHQQDTTDVPLHALQAFRKQMRNCDKPVVNLAAVYPGIRVQSCMLSGAVLFRRIPTPVRATLPLNLILSIHISDVVLAESSC
jgi:hypothetical protein